MCKINQFSTNYRNCSNSKKMLLPGIMTACTVLVQYCITCLISIEGCSWEIEIVCKAGSALLSRTVSPSVRSDKHWTVITPICGRIAQHRPGTVQPCAQCSAPRSFRQKNRFKLLEEEKKGTKNPLLDYSPI